MNQLLAMRVFVSVAESGSFSRAAERMRLSTTATSRYVSQLERHLGARLLQRNTRSLHLTDTGHSYFERCSQILADIDAAEASASAADSRPQGTLRVSVPYCLGMRYIGPLLPAFRAQYPDLALEVNYSDRAVDLVQEGIDVAVRITSELNTNLIARRLATVHLLPCAAPAYLARQGTPQHPDELRRHNCLTYTYSVFGHSWQFRQGDTALAVPVQGDFLSNSADMLRRAALNGLGIILQPSFLIGPDLRAGRLQRLLPDYEADSHGAYAVYLAGARRSARVKAFVDFFAQALGGDDPVWDRPNHQPPEWF